MMPFALPLGNYYEKVYKPAIEKAGLKAVRAGTEIFGAGKIMDQVWSGINAKVLVAELTSVAWPGQLRSLPACPTESPD